MSSIPGVFKNQGREPNLPPGGVLLKSVGEQEFPRTGHTTTFNGCNLSWRLNVEDFTVVSYTLMIHDPVENHVYEYTMQEGVKNIIQAVLNEMPAVGTRLGEDGKPLQEQRPGTSPEDLLAPGGN